MLFAVVFFDVLASIFIGQFDVDMQCRNDLKQNLIIVIQIVYISIADIYAIIP